MFELTRRYRQCNPVPTNIICKRSAEIGPELTSARPISARSPSEIPTYARIRRPHATSANRETISYITATSLLVSRHNYSRGKSLGVLVPSLLSRERAAWPRSPRRRLSPFSVSHNAVMVVRGAHGGFLIGEAGSSQDPIAPTHDACVVGFIVQSSIVHQCFEMLQQLTIFADQCCPACYFARMHGCSHGTLCATAGGGAWGTALAAHTARQGHSTILWAREEAVVTSINGPQHENSTFLPVRPLTFKSQSSCLLAQARLGHQILDPRGVCHTSSLTFAQLQ